VLGQQAGGIYRILNKIIGNLQQQFFNLFV
jgi:hypothetical protein